MSEPMTTPEELKDCPLCSEKGQSIRITEREVDARCSNRDCALHTVWIPLAQWNTRPREKALEGVLRDARLRAQGRLRVHWNSVEQLSRGEIKECICAECESNAGTVAAINAALEEKR